MKRNTYLFEVSRTGGAGGLSNSSKSEDMIEIVVTSAMNEILVIDVYLCIRSHFLFICCLINGESPNTYCYVLADYNDISKQQNKALLFLMIRVNVPRK